jgi:uncharacterized protein YkwD
MRWASVIVLLAGLLVLQTGSVAAAPAQTDTAFVARVLDLTNSERQQGGLKPLALSPELNEAAQKYSQVLASSGCFDHTCGPVPNFADRVGQAGYTGWTALAENIAAGYPTPETVVAGWMASTGHRANILSPKYTEMGIGRVSGTGQLGTYWTQEFGSRPMIQAPQAPAPAQSPLQAEAAPQVQAAPTDDGAAPAKSDGGTGATGDDGGSGG